MIHAGKYSSRFQQKTAVTSNLAPTPRWKGIKLFLCIIIENTDTAGSDIFLARMRPPFLKYRFLQVDIKYSFCLSFNYVWIYCTQETIGETRLDWLTKNHHSNTIPFSCAIIFGKFFYDVNTKFTFFKNLLRNCVTRFGLDPVYSNFRIRIQIYWKKPYRYR